jgi:hypothetical protein
VFPTYEAAKAETVLVFFHCKDSHLVSTKDNDDGTKEVLDKFGGRVEHRADAAPPAFAEWLKRQQKQQQGREVHIAFVLVSADALATEQLPDADRGWEETAPDGERQTALPAVERARLPNEGFSDIAHMKNWLPTAGYNLESAHAMRSLWRGFISSDGNASGGEPAVAELPWH